MAGHTAVMFDNLSGRFGDMFLDQALTASRWQGRILGESKDYRGPLNVVWYGTGNNVQLCSDTPRRILPIRLETDEERPELLTGYKHKYLLSHVRLNRARLLSAALTILRGWHVAGRPKHKLPPFGSFQGWSDVVREAIVFAGLPDPGLTRDMMTEEADRDAANMLTNFANWQNLDPAGNGVTAGEIVSKLKPSAAEPTLSAWACEVRDAVEKLCGRLDSRALGFKFRHFKGRNFGGQNLVKAGEDRSETGRWTVRPVAGRGNAGDAQPSPANEKRRKSDVDNDIQKVPTGDAGDAGDVPSVAENNFSYQSNPVRGVPGLDTEGVA